MHKLTIRSLLCALATATAAMAPSYGAYYRNHVARVPATPTSAQFVRVWIDSDTADGETAALNWHNRTTGQWQIVRATKSSDYLGANWYADIPAFADGTQVEYQLFTYNQSNEDYGWTPLAWSYTVTDPNVSVGSAVHSAPAAYDGKMYFGADDGKMYGYAIGSKTALGGFPYDATAAAGVGAKILGRPALRSIGGSLYLFFLTDNGYIFRLHLDSDGSLDAAASYQPDASATNVSTTPAVFPIGGVDYVFAAMNTSSGARLFKVATTTLDSSDVLDFGGSTTVSSSPAGGGGVDLYVGVNGGSQGILRVQASSMTIATSLATGESVSGSPFISGTTSFGQPFPTLFAGTDSGKVIAANATNGNVVTAFGSGGTATVATGQRLTSVFLWNNALWTTGATDGHIYRINADPAANNTSYGVVTDWYNVNSESGGGNLPGGLAISPAVGGKDYLVWGTNNGRFYRVNAADATEKTIYKLNSGGVFTTPALDVATAQVVAGNSDGKVYIYPR